jgi:cold shock CspA family protein
MPERAVGRLVSWNRDRSFGHVRRDYGVGDVFISGREVRRSGISEDDLKIGMRLAFELFQDDNGRRPWAANISVVSKAPA